MATYAWLKAAAFRQRGREFQEICALPVSLSMALTSRKTPLWKILGYIAIGPVVLLLAAYVWVKVLESRRWSEMEARVADLAKEAEDRDRTRAVLRGVPEEGNAWDDYEKAVQTLATKKLGPLEDAPRYFYKRPGADRTKVELLIVQYSAELSSLRRGAGRAFARRELAWKDGKRDYFGNPLHLVFYLAMCQARILSETARSREGAELLLDMAQVSGDLGRNLSGNAASFSIDTQGWALDELKDIVLSGRLETKDLLQVDRELGILDQSLPRFGDASLNDVGGLGKFYLKQEEGGEYDGLTLLFTSMSSWRYGFSTRLASAEAFAEALDSMRRAADASEKRWPEARVILYSMDARLQGTKNPRLSGWSWIYVSNREVHYRLHRTKLRLLRSMTHHLATGEVLDLEDPFGDKLLSSSTNGVLSVWSVGIDGKDNQDLAGDIVIRREKRDER